MMRYLIYFCFLLNSFDLLSQVTDVNELDSTYINWINKDYEIDQVVGTSVTKAYAQLLKGKKPRKKVIVAVIDSGVDIEHEDLQGKIWVNEDEIPENGIDDDQNGYVDDIHGWNFIGNSSGENINYENLEYTRIFKSGDTDNSFFEEAKTLYEKEFKERYEERENLMRFEMVYTTAKAIISEATGVEVGGLQDIADIQSDDERVNAAKEFLKERYTMGFTEKELEAIINQNTDYMDYYLNTNFNPRDIIGDDPTDLSDANYGNQDVKGPRAEHGTAVAGIIAAVRDNGIGINGIADHVQIMPIRSTPNGDERDKDVALSIRYAVDNGADIINMSFGKSISPQKQFVDEAVRYAEEHDVLLVHAAGNSGQNIDVIPSFPSDRYLDGTNIETWLNVGASSKDHNEEIVTVFSNYGREHVDLFAPGASIVSLDTSNTYNIIDGTSFAAPVVSGIAALVLSYYPDLTAKELVKILTNSTNRIPKLKKVLVPSETFEKRNKEKFKKLSKSGGIANAYNALIEAEKYLIN